ncbi:mucin-17-like [Xyrichtys novacula]|nr:mucin-17-like [Xyrichtys novacula]
MSNFSTAQPINNQSTATSATQMTATMSNVLSSTGEVASTSTSEDETRGASVPNETQVNGATSTSGEELNPRSTQKSENQTLITTTEISTTSQGGHMTGTKKSVQTSSSLDMSTRPESDLLEANQDIPPILSDGNLSFMGTFTLVLNISGMTNSSAETQIPFDSTQRPSTSILPQSSQQLTTQESGSPLPNSTVMETVVSPLTSAQEMRTLLTLESTHTGDLPTNISVNATTPKSSLITDHSTTTNIADTLQTDALSVSTSQEITKTQPKLTSKRSSDVSSNTNYSSLDGSTAMTSLGVPIAGVTEMTTTPKVETTTANLQTMSTTNLKTSRPTSSPEQKTSLSLATNSQSVSQNMPSGAVGINATQGQNSGYIQTTKQTTDFFPTQLSPFAASDSTPEITKTILSTTDLISSPKQGTPFKTTVTSISSTTTATETTSPEPEPDNLTTVGSKSQTTQTTLTVEKPVITSPEQQQIMVSTTTSPQSSNTTPTRPTAKTKETGLPNLPNNVTLDSKSTATAAAKEFMSTTKQHVVSSINDPDPTSTTTLAITLPGTSTQTKALLTVSTAIQMQSTPRPTSTSATSALTTSSMHTPASVTTAPTTASHNLTTTRFHSEIQVTSKVSTGPNTSTTKVETQTLISPIQETNNNNPLSSESVTSPTTTTPSAGKTTTAPKTSKITTVDTAALQKSTSTPEQSSTAHLSTTQTTSVENKLSEIITNTLAELLSSVKQPITASINVTPVPSDSATPTKSTTFSKSSESASPVSTTTMTKKHTTPTHITPTLTSSITTQPQNIPDQTTGRSTKDAGAATQTLQNTPLVESATSQTSLTESPTPSVSKPVHSTISTHSGPLATSLQAKPSTTFTTLTTESVKTKSTTTPVKNIPLTAKAPSTPTQAMLLVTTTTQTQSSPATLKLISTKMTISAETLLKNSLGTPMERQTTIQTPQSTAQKLTSIPSGGESTSLLTQVPKSITVSSKMIHNQLNASATVKPTQYSTLATNQQQSTKQHLSASSLTGEAPRGESTNTQLPTSYFPTSSQTDVTTTEAVAPITQSTGLDSETSEAAELTTTPFQVTSKQSTPFVTILHQTTTAEHMTVLTTKSPQSTAYVRTESLSSAPSTVSITAADTTTVYSTPPNHSDSMTKLTQTTTSVATAYKTQTGGLMETVPTMPQTKLMPGATDSLNSPTQTTLSLVSVQQERSTSKAELKTTEETARSLTTKSTTLQMLTTISTQRTQSVPTLQKTTAITIAMSSTEVPTPPNPPIKQPATTSSQDTPSVPTQLQTNDIEAKGESGTSTSENKPSVSSQQQTTVFQTTPIVTAATKQSFQAASESSMASTQNKPPVTILQHNMDEQSTVQETMLPTQSMDLAATTISNTQSVSKLQQTPNIEATVRGTQSISESATSSTLNTPLFTTKQQTTDLETAVGGAIILPQSSATSDSATTSTKNTFAVSTLSVTETVTRSTQKTPIVTTQQQIIDTKSTTRGTVEPTLSISSITELATANTQKTLFMSDLTTPASASSTTEMPTASKPHPATVQSLTPTISGSVTTLSGEASTTQVRGSLEPNPTAALTEPPVPTVESQRTSSSTIITPGTTLAPTMTPALKQTATSLRTDPNTSTHQSLPSKATSENRALHSTATLVSAPEQSTTPREMTKQPTAASSNSAFSGTTTTTLVNGLAGTLPTSTGAKTSGQSLVFSKVSTLTFENAHSSTTPPQTSKTTEVETTTTPVSTGMPTTPRPESITDEENSSFTDMLTDKSSPAPSTAPFSSSAPPGFTLKTTSPYSSNSTTPPVTGKAKSVTDSSSLPPPFSKSTSTTNSAKANTTQDQFDVTSVSLLRGKTVFFQHSPKTVTVRPISFDYPIVMRTTFIFSDGFNAEQSNEDIP